MKLILKVKNICIDLAMMVFCKLVKIISKLVKFFERKLVLLKIFSVFQAQRWEWEIKKERKINCREAHSHWAERKKLVMQGQNVYAGRGSRGSKGGICIRPGGSTYHYWGLILINSYWMSRSHLFEEGENGITGKVIPRLAWNSMIRCGYEGRENPGWVLGGSDRR